ncbi:hypothetical protein [Ralstonia syzygii]|nr:hypothetical protein [Ralstonia syzygii]
MRIAIIGGGVIGNAIAFSATGFSGARNAESPAAGRGAKYLRCRRIPLA